MLRATAPAERSVVHHGLKVSGPAVEGRAGYVGVAEAPFAPLMIS
jgi:hypothetical protein